MTGTFYQFPAKVGTDAKGHQALLDFYSHAGKSGHFIGAPIHLIFHFE